MTNSEFLDAALLYASMGWPVFPLQPRQKDKFAVSSWKNECSTDEAQIREWWGRNPNYNIGIATGNGLCVIDVDDKPDKHPVLGSDMLRDWELDHGEISETCCVKTGTGGMHYYFNVGDTRISGCQSDTIFIDLRCDGNYIVAPPSIHPDTGQPYTWDISPEDMPPAKATSTDKACIQWVYDNRRGADKDGKRGKVKVPKERVRDGEGRNNFLYEQGCSARAKGSDDDTIAAWLSTLNQMKCDPPLPEAELKKIINSVCSLPIGLSEEAKAQEKRGRGRPRKFDHAKVAHELIEKRGAAFVDGMPALREPDFGRYVTGWDAFDAAIIDMNEDSTTSNRKEVKAFVQAKAPRLRQSPWNLIAFKNGVLDINTMEFRDWLPTDVIPNVIPHNWNPEASSELLDHTLDRMACGDMAVLCNLTEFIGVCMMRSVKRCPVFPVLIGEGSNGKSTYIGLLKDVVGEENISGLQPKDITARFLGAHIVGKTANLGDDIASGYLDDRDCSIIKSVATGDLMFTDVKGGTGFKFEPYCTMVFSCNAFPRLADTTPGFMRRFMPIEFNAVFKRTDPDYDPMIGDKLREESVLEYACVLGVEGLRRVISQNGPTPNELAEAMKGDLAREGNTALQWFNDEGITAERIVGLTKEEVHQQYVAWCERNGYARTAMASGTLSAQIGTYFRLRCQKLEHRDYSDGRKTVRVYDYKNR